MFYTKSRRPEKVLEPGGGDRIVESAGYVPAKTLIESFLLAGYRLDQSRAEAYDFAPGADIDEDFEDVTRRPDFDLADAARLARDLNKRLKAYSDRPAVVPDKPEDGKTELPKSKADEALLDK